MSEKTLYLVQSHFANTQSALSKLNQISTQQDSIVLMGDAVLAADSVQLKNTTQLYMLENDAELFASQPHTDIKIINYAEFSDLVLSFQRCISLK
ncbi:hypothetical protein G9F31_03420 [Acinetobacter sp. 187]|uniref:Sulfurtransferase complex subunit TusB n=1 Tax=Acinetobacter lanii TaxID=2715163 RepID=A0A6G8S415_9GAMM|nr:DsrH/TusB family sulfur metabolism protein [Acinetobacter lanii]NHC02823.1 hypothetical protein [Acinetobacter lanii]QIO08885.1 hypothetical protein G8D99_07575 [Acinetobacter lanii]